MEKGNGANDRTENKCIWYASNTHPLKRYDQVPLGGFRGKKSEKDGHRKSETGDRKERLKGCTVEGGKGKTRVRKTGKKGGRLYGWKGEDENRK